MIKAIALDDEYHALDRFNTIAKETGEIEVCGLFETVSKFLDYLKDNPCDVVFLDIEMPGRSGMDIIDDILNLHSGIEIVFVTAFNQYALQAFENSAIDYILKPLTFKRLLKTINRINKIAKQPAEEQKPFFKCFGSFEIYIHGKPVIWRNAKTREIMAFLVHKEGAAVSWEVITETVWPDYDDFEKAHTNFHSTMYLLRKRLNEMGIENILECRRGNYRIHIDKVSCDYYDFTKLPPHEQKNMVLGIYMEENGYQ